MSFLSFNFWLVFPIIFGLYWLIPVRYNTLRKVFLILVSYLLYMNWKPAFALVLLGVTVITYFGGYLLEKNKKEGSRKRIALFFAILSLLPLLVFKYYNFINDSIHSGLEHLGVAFNLPGLNWAIPVGISFFSFQAVGYLLDVYHGKTSAEKNIIDYILFVSFFPQITSGPISKAAELLPQIKKSHPFDYEQGKQGLKFLVWGMFLKIVIADRLGLYVDNVFPNYDHYNSVACIVAILFYTLQIYTDFAGYSYIAIGIAGILGFDLINNFNRPYFAQSVSEFWRRWHISLTRWLTQNIYIPLGGSRCSNFRCWFNIIITFLVSGIWHGANWTFIIWGLIHGFLLVFDRIAGLNPKGKVSQTADSKKYLKPIRIFLTFILVSVAWIFFRMPTVGDSLGIIGHMFSADNASTIAASGINTTLIVLPFLFVKDFKDEFLSTRLKFMNHPAVHWAWYVLLFVMIIGIGVLDSGQFIYVSF